MKNFTLFLLFGLLLSIGCQTAKNVFPEPTSEPAFLSVRQAVSLPSAGSAITLDVATNASTWSAEAVYPDGAPTTNWLTLTQVLGTPAQLVITAAENSVMDERWAEVTISSPNLPVQTIRVVQFGTTRKILIVDAQGRVMARKSINAKDQSFGFMVLTNCPTYEVTLSEGSGAWLTIDSPSRSKAFDDYTEGYTANATKNISTESGRSAIITAKGTGLGVGVSIDLIVDQAPDAVLNPIPASYLSYTNGDGTNAVISTPEGMFDNNFTTFGETGYQTSQGGPLRHLDIEVKADKLFQIAYYPRNYNPTTGKKGSTHQYPADFKIYIQKKNTSTWVEVAPVAMRGDSATSTNYIYGNLKWSTGQVPYLVYDGAALTDVRKVRFAITATNAMAGVANQNNQFWNASEIKFLGVAASELDPVKAPIIGATYNWDSGPGGDGDDITKLYDGVKDVGGYWQSSYGAVPDDVLAAGTVLSLTLDAVYEKFSELRYYIRNSKSQVPVSFDLYVDPGTGITTNVKSFLVPAPWANALPGSNSIKLSTPVKAQKVLLHVKEAGGATKMHFCASEIEAYYLP